jgi:alanyl-tRNA synthetase
MPIEEAKKLGAIALFGEKYGDNVRVVKYGPSVEFCGGTHTSSTGRIGMIKIISESSVAAGVRRIEAVSAAKAEELFNAQQDTLRTLKEMFNNVPNLEQAIRKAVEENAELKKDVEKFVQEKVQQQKAALIEKAEIKGDVKIISLPTGTEMPAEMVKSIGFQIRNDVKDKFVFIAGTKKDGKPTLTVVMSDALVATGLNASQMIREAAKEILGGGGGQPFFAQAGGKNADGLQKAVDILKSKF